MNQEQREYGVVLAGGGAKGAYQIGAWKAIKELGLNVKAISGVSIGAINGAMIIQDDIEKLQELYKNIEIQDVMEINSKINIKKNILNIANLTKVAKDYRINRGLSNEPLKKLLKQYINIEKIYNSPIEFGLLTLRAKDRTPVKKFKNDIKKEEFIDYLLATSCFPIFKPQKIGEEEYLDGGLYDNTPVNLLIEKGYKNIILIDVAGIGLRRKLLDKNIYLKIIEPTEHLCKTFEFDQTKMKRNIKLGYLDTMRAFNKLQGHIYYFEISEFNKMIELYGLKTIYGLEYAAQIYEMDKTKIYKTEEFITELIKRHKLAQQKYDKIKKILKGKKIFDLKNQQGQIKDIFDKGLGLCFATDIYLDKPTSKRFKYLEHFIKDHTLSVKALLNIQWMN